jgi:hypothetical protein
MFAPQPPIWVEKGSLEYSLFIQRMLDSPDERSLKQVCVLCWAFINDREERVAHPEHKDFIIGNPSIKDEAAFLQLAEKYGKIDGNRVAIINNKAVFSEIGTNASAESVVIQNRPPIVVKNNQIYTNCTQEMYDLEEFERPETRYLARDPDMVNNTISLEDAKRFAVPQLNICAPLTGPFSILGKEETLA